MVGVIAQRESTSLTWKGSQVQSLLTSPFFYLTMHAQIFVFAFFYFYRLILLFVSFLCDTIKTNRKKQKQTNMSFGGDLDDW